MRLALALLGAMCLQVLLVPRGSAQDHVELFGGYAFAHASEPVTTTILCPGPPCPITISTYHPNLNGWEFAGTFKPGSWIGITGDFNGNYGSIGNAHTHLQTYLAGPTVSFPGRVSPFAHVLFGDAHESVGNGSAGGVLVTVPTSTNAFATVAGVGIDIKVLPFISVRPIQVDYLITRFNSSTQNQPRASAGIVLRF